MSLPQVEALQDEDRDAVRKIAEQHGGVDVNADGRITIVTVADDHVDEDYYLIDGWYYEPLSNEEELAELRENAPEAEWRKAWEAAHAACDHKDVVDKVCKDIETREELMWDSERSVQNLPDHPGVAVPVTIQLTETELNDWEEWDAVLMGFRDRAADRAQAVVTTRVRKKPPSP